MAFFFYQSIANNGIPFAHSRRVTKVSIDDWKEALQKLEKGQLNSKLIFWSE